MAVAAAAAAAADTFPRDWSTSDHPPCNTAHRIHYSSNTARQTRCSMAVVGVGTEQ